MSHWARINEWLEHRTGISTAVRKLFYEEIPASSGWHQVFGSVALFLFLVQAFTGVLLALNYAPSPGEAYNSLQYILTEVTAGRLMRGLHHWGASMLIVVVVLHMTQVFLFGAYKKPREATWMVGVVLLLLTLAYGLTGYLLPWDNRAYWGTVVATNIAARAPLLGPYLTSLLGGKDSIGVVTFARFFALHVLLLPPATTLLIFFHIYLVRKHGVAPAPGDEYVPKKRFYPEQAFKDTLAIFVAFVILFIMAVVVRVPLERAADPTDTAYTPRPEWYFLFLFQTLKFFSGSLEVVGSVVLPGLAVLLLLVVPFIDRDQVVAVTRRTFALTFVALAAIAWTALTAAAVITTPKGANRATIDFSSPSDWLQLSPWKRYKRGYARFAQTRPDTKRLMADYGSDIDQISIPDMNVVDRCTTCHQGISQSTLAEASVPQPYRAHPIVPHQVKEWGCVICHRGQGLATEAGEAHETTLAWEQPILPVSFIQGSCGTCHRADIPQAPRLRRGRELLVQFNCVGCHRLQGIERPVMLGPDLTNIGTKVSREWLYKWLKEPRTIVDATGKVTVNGYETGDEPRMPKFRLSEQELKGLTAYLSSLRSTPVAPYKFDPRVVAAWEKKPDLVEQGEVRFRQMFCSTCHGLAVTRAGEAKLIGGDIGPELTKVGSKANPDWLVAWLRDPQSYLPHAQMPRYGWSDEDLYVVTQYITAKLVDPDLLSDVPKLGPSTAEEVQLGRRLFLEKGCPGCHTIEGVPSQKDFGPDLSNLGGKNVSQLEFGQAKIPRNLIAYIQAKLTDPVSVNPAARMPQYYLNSADIGALTVALLSMSGPASSSGMERLIVPRKQAALHPAGRFGEVYERYKCYVCHQFNGYGGTLAPDLSFEGSRARWSWIVEFLKNPQTLRPTLTFRMPQFNMTDEEAAVLADNLGKVFQSPAARPVDERAFTPGMAAKGKQLYEVKYQCQSCHTIGLGGGYVGPNLSNVGKWMAAGWIEAWLRNPQALVPEAIEPRRAFTDDEIEALTAYLLTLRQTAKPVAAKGAGR